MRSQLRTTCRRNAEDVMDRMQHSWDSMQRPVTDNKKLTDFVLPSNIFLGSGPFFFSMDQLPRTWMEERKDGWKEGTSMS